MKKVWVPRELVYTKYWSNHGVRTRSCILAMTFDSHSTFLTRRRRAAARHGLIVWSYRSWGNVPGVSAVMRLSRSLSVGMYGERSPSLNDISCGLVGLDGGSSVNVEPLARPPGRLALSVASSPSAPAEMGVRCAEDGRATMVKLSRSLRGREG